MGKKTDDYITVIQKFKTSRKSAKQLRELWLLFLLLSALGTFFFLFWLLGEYFNGGFEVKFPPNKKPPAVFRK